jgi:transcriptional regulator
VYLPRHFEQHDPHALRELMRVHPLATLVRAAPDGFAADPVPLVVDGDVLRGHVARANPLWREADGAQVLAVFTGPEGYVSPSAYAAKREHGKVVPTWNYATVHAHGTLRAVDDAEWLRAFVTRLTERHEATRAEPWAVSDAPDDYIEQMLRAIVGIEIAVTRLEGKWKASQNRSAVDREGVAAQAAPAMAALVRGGSA